MNDSPPPEFPHASQGNGSSWNMSRGQPSNHAPPTLETGASGMPDRAGHGRTPSQPALPPTSSSVVARSAATYAFGSARDPAQQAQAPAGLATSEVLEEDDEDGLAEQDSARKHAKSMQGIPHKGNAQGSAALGAERVADDLLPVYCAGTKGLFHRSTSSIECYCGPCTRNRASKGQAMLTPTEFEKHSGMAASKKWKYTVRVDMPNRPPIGSFLDKLSKKSKNTQNGAPKPPMAPAPGQPALAPTQPALAPAQPPHEQPSADVVTAVKPELPLVTEANGDRTPEAGAPVKLNNIQRPKSRTGKAARPKPKSAPSGKGDIENMPTTLAGVPFEDMTEEQQKQYLALKASGKKWLGTKTTKLAVQGITREGVQYQAQVPAEPIAMHPIGREENDPRAALAMLSAAEALVSVMGRELASTRKLPPDATHDLELLPPEPPEAPLERHERRRKRPQWLSNTIDPHHITTMKGLPPEPSPSAPAEMSGGAESEGRAAVANTFVGPGGYGGGDLEAPFMPGFNKRKRSNIVPKRQRTGDPASRRMDNVPQVLEWEVLPDKALHALVSFQGNTYDLQGHAIRESGAAYLEEQPQYHNGRYSQHGGYQGYSEDSGRYVEEAGWEPEPHGGRELSSAQYAGDLYRGGDADAVDVESFRALDNAPADATTERRLAADAAYDRMLVEGPPANATCCICELPPDKGARPASGSWEALRCKVDRHPKGLGALVLVRASVIASKWCHEQCAVWAPEVVEKGLHHLPDAVRRGRMLKCQVCKQKGATLGCHVRTCRHSFHLQCARDRGCSLQVRSGKVTCLTHLHKVARDDDDGGPPARNQGAHGDGWQGHQQGSHTGQGWRRSTYPGPGANSQSRRETSFGPPEGQGTRSGRVRPSRARDDEGAYGNTPNARFNGDDDDFADGRPQPAKPPAGTRLCYPDNTSKLRQQAAERVQEGNLKLADFQLEDGSFDPDMIAALDPDLPIESARVNRMYGGTMGQSSLRAGRCAVCVVQRKGKCGTMTAPKPCSRRLGYTLMRRHGGLPEEPAWQSAARAAEADRKEEAMNRIPRPKRGQDGDATTSMEPSPEADSIPHDEEDGEASEGEDLLHPVHHGNAQDQNAHSNGPQAKLGHVSRKYKTHAELLAALDNVEPEDQDFTSDGESDSRA